MADPVSRETPAPPASATQVFGDRLDDVARLSVLLGGAGIDRGLIGPRELPRLWDRHLVNCGLLAGDLPPAARVADVGSGAGLPGLVLALARPDVEITLVEPLLRRTTFLQEAVESLGVAERVRVVRSRAEELHGTAEFDVVTARAVARLPQLATWCLPLVRRGGELWAMKGEQAEVELAEAAAIIHRLHGSAVGVTTYGADLASPTRVVRVRRS